MRQATQEEKSELLSCGLEEMELRSGFVYSIKGFLYRNLGLFKKHNEYMQSYYEKKYPAVRLLNEGKIIG